MKQAEKSSEIRHAELGSIYVKWNEERLLVTGININESFSETERAETGHLKARFPELYEFLANFGRKSALTYPIECLDFSWASFFYRKVYRALYGVGVGRVITYGELAEIAGNPRAARAVGTAMNKNRYPVAIACHRVIGKGRLGNFACGMDVKKTLLRLEGRSDIAEMKP